MKDGFTNSLLVSRFFEHLSHHFGRRFEHLVGVPRVLHEDAEMVELLDVTILLLVPSVFFGDESGPIARGLDKVEIVNDFELYACSPSVEP